MSSPLSQAAPMHLDTDLALSQIGDQDAMMDMLGLLHESLASDIPAIAHALQSGDGVEANRLLHALKGFIPIFCAKPLCDQVASVERLSKAPHSAELVLAYADLRPHLEKLLAEVQAGLLSLQQRT